MLTIADIETTLNEIALEDEVLCEFEHDFRVPCSIKVTHRVESTCDHIGGNLCENATTFEKLTMHFTNCASCYRPADICWIIRPI